ncbi:phosphopentomutase [Buchnera aphidicola]|uniref:Phosphopentomutase n=1 Tax=Buchnera aphidicola subsp. Acyrthosiphon pisum (strain Tuc7) TaxID=561501 RepID=DEOB_BUCAT|nr:phosphopentomutase [Buchnera aphidicola]B8D866.1 RecName: Full=Phosphopentomutase; AltName: Full=Phosphodeoxyribomutase [Buchnera aphidicola str. Tuc7 (Acyrthosiphon pisum)]ADP66919.1 phosphopentomutase [Buchnera aphidicola str. TLW03 (Acyrthosiphon pisum)]ACL30331.1 phosphopentomutase [Buchnera aphidicola str. Tuc7 (Acyrthosiphon pisum)]ADP66345.1 phosphopentomutase [Buchnera aphidicola str. LL01 (Acyrthosiphon pisum)]ADP67507.1 phosphopentomutase [Buchnera aphidicola str. JF99 (Acyrthosip
MKRVFLIVLDSFGIGSSPDADKFNDVGSNTFGHIVEKCFLGEANVGRKGVLCIPNLVKLGIINAAKESTGQYPLGFNYSSNVIASYGFASEISSGKDTTSGHWEIAGVPVLDDWCYFKEKQNSFPESLLEKIIRRSELTGFIGNCHASGTDIISRLGEEHIQTKKPIVYTSSDSVFQIACHEEFFGLSNLYKLCKTVRFILDRYNYKVARVIARPFIGNDKLQFQRTGNRRDFSIKPFATTVIKKLIDEKQGQVIAIGKVSDIYGGIGISKNIKSTGLYELCSTTIHEMKKALNNTIVFTNLVDFDSNWGHRRDVSGYAKGLELFDSRLSEIISLVQKNDLLILTADHGCDPTWIGTDHTRENVPVLIYSPGIKKNFLGHRKTFADIGQTIAKYFLLTDMSYGQNML